jgi:hypothetical protein
MELAVGDEVGGGIGAVGVGVSDTVGVGVRVGVTVGVAVGELVGVFDVVGEGEALLMMWPMFAGDGNCRTGWPASA